MATTLPQEILLQIFDLATDEDLIFQPALPDATAQSAWFSNVFGDWALRTPQEALNLIQRRSYATKKAILRTCRLWRSIGAQFMFRSLFFDSPSRLYNASFRLVRSSEHAKNTSTGLGWWTRRIHLARYYAPSDDAPGDALYMESSLIAMLKCCPNLEIFVVDYPLGSSFGPVASALAISASRSLRTVHWSIPSSQLSKVIWALDSLPSLVSVSLDFSAPQLASSFDEEDPVPLGAASHIAICLDNLQQFFLKGQFAEFMDQATGWTLPSIRSFSIDTGSQTSQEPDIVPFLRQHGLNLSFLALECILPLDVPLVLELCPSLTAFTFNGDWPLQMTSTALGTSPLFVNQSHANLQYVGMYGLGHAFGTGYGAALSSVDPIRAALICQNNEVIISTLARLKMLGSLPKLKIVRALSRSLLSSLERNNGPAPGDPMERWENWYGRLERSGIRFEDCTGNLLGTLPAIEGDSDESEGEDDDVRVGQDSGWKSTIAPSGGMVSELRQLVEECLTMTAAREEGLFSSFADQWQGPGSEMTDGLPLLTPSSTSGPSSL